MLPARARSLLPVLVALASFVAGCSTNPETGKHTLNYLSKADEVKLGEEAAPQFTQEFGGKVDSPACQAYVTNLGNKLKDQIDRKDYADLPWEFTFLNSDVVNAFALPGGKVFITRGLAADLSSEAQMAGVLGHEIGHVTAEHGDQRITQQVGFNVIMAGLAIGVGVAGNDTAVGKYGQYAVPAIAVGGNVVLLKYGRDEELEADALGMKYMSRAGYDPRAQREVMEILGKLSGGSSPPEWLSTHPASETRIQKIDQALATTYASTQNNPKYGEYAERYKSDFLTPLSKVPAAPKPQKQADLLANPAAWCAICAARQAALPETEEPRPVAPREGVYAFFAPPPR